MILSPGKDEALRNFNVIHKSILPNREESKEATSKPNESSKEMEPGTCLDLATGSGDYCCDQRSCMRIESFQRKDLALWFGDINEKEKIDVQIIAVSYASTTVSLATALGFFSRKCSLESPQMLESEQPMLTSLIVESWPGVLQRIQKYIRGWNVGLEAEMAFPVSEAYSLPINAKSLVRSVMANLCGSHYSLNMAMLEASSQRVLIYEAFSVPKCVRLARMSHHSHRMLQKMLGAVSVNRVEDLSEIWREELLSLEKENISHFERQNAFGKATSITQAVDENDVTHMKMIEFEPLLEASGERNLRSINLTLGEYSCHNLAQTVMEIC